MPADIGTPDSYPNLLKYPQNVGSAEQPHSVIFYINAREGSPVAPGSDSAERATTAWRNSQTDLSDQYTLENRISSEKNGELVTFGTQVAGAAVGGKLVSDLIPGKNIFGKAISWGAGIIIGAEAGEAVGEKIGKKYNTVRLTTAIQLHIPQALVSAYSADWNEESLGTLTGMIANGAFSLGDMSAQQAVQAGSFGARQALIAAASVPKALGLNEDFGAGVNASEKRVANPFREQLFKSMGFRQFRFNYEFAPRNFSEYSQVKQIISLLKKNMHPSITDGGFFLSYPGEFNIEYRYGTRKNENVAQVSSCALTDMKVTYGADGAFNTFEGTNGAPTEIQMELSFTELEVLTANRVEEGGL